MEHPVIRTRICDLPAIFARLKAILQPLVPPLRVEADSPAGYSLLANPTAKYPQGLFFGAVRVGKNYVSYYLMPVYVCPDLLDGLSTPLKKRMQGKSCFNFTTIDPGQVKELTVVTKRSVARFNKKTLEKILPW